MGEATGVDQLTTIRHDGVRAFRPGPLCTAMMASRRLPYIYVQNWKCGCSTVKNTLWNIEHALGLSARPGYPHQDGDDSPFVADQQRWEQLEREFVFTIVRNPYSRVLSGYLDQIARHRNKQAWGQFALRHGLSDRIPTFREFLLLLAETPHGEMNPHWRPQYCNVAPKLIPYDFIGAMENLAEDLPYALGRIFRDGLAQHDCVGHRTGASSKLREYYGPTEIELVQRIYEEDFSSLGYGMDPTASQRVAETARPESDPLLAWGRANRHLNAGRYEAALADLGLVRARVSGPPVDELILRCSRAILSGVELIERSGGPLDADADLWKRYGKTLRSLRRYEDALVARIHAARLRSPNARRDARLRRLRWQLALLQASRGSAERAVATLSPRGDGHGIAARALVRGLTAVAWGLAAPWWHPDQSVGTPKLSDKR
jgi:hypothetical protein